MSQAALSDEASAPARGSGAWIPIVAINLVPVWGVVFEGWAVFTLFALFWLDLVLLIVMNGLRIAIAQPRSIPKVPILWLGDGLFAVGYAMAITAFFARPNYDAIMRAENPLDPAAHLFESLDLWPQLAALAVVHLLMLMKYVLSGEYRTADVKALEGAALLRMIVLHLALFIGAFASGTVGYPLWSLLCLVALKIGMELGLQSGAVQFTRG